MSEYLNRLKQRRDATPPPGNAPNVQSNVTFRKAIDYIEDLEHKIVLAENQERYLLARLKEADEKYNELCDEMRVQGELNEMSDEASRD